MNERNYKPININGNVYYTIERFALITNKSIVTIKNLTIKGNRIRKLKLIEIMEKKYIPASELIEYPFTVAGKHNFDTYHYDEKGEIVTITQKQKQIK